LTLYTVSDFEGHCHRSLRRDLVRVFGGIESTARGADAALNGASSLNDVREPVESLGE
jgi:hypothetical protein